MCSIWLAELARELPDSVHLDGFDISDEQYPPSSWYGDNVSLQKLDIFKPVPKELQGRYDVVALRFFMCVASDDNIQVVVDNLCAMLSKSALVHRSIMYACLKKRSELLHVLFAAHFVLDPVLIIVANRTRWLSAMG